ncbi:MAG: hypothetical protein K2J79_00415, partial [Ruminiclostridium sp.]|nr:hypothetical protein [Ruminiclostridium sp.]
TTVSADPNEPTDTTVTTADQNQPAETGNTEESTNSEEVGNGNNTPDNNGDNTTSSPNPSTGLAITLAPLGTATVIAVITSKRKKK